MKIDYKKKLEIGKRIEKIRLSKHMSQMQFGGSIDCDQSRISMYERGELLVRSVDLINIAIVHNISPEYILFGEKENNNAERKTEKEKVKI